MYIGLVQDFCHNARHALARIVDELAGGFKRIHDKDATRTDRDMWALSIRTLADSLERAGLNRQIVMLEHCLPKADAQGWPCRIDAMILGTNAKGDHMIAVIEVKNWKRILGESCGTCTVKIRSGDSTIHKLHPAAQSLSYEIMLQELATLCTHNETYLNTIPFAYVDLMGSDITAGVRTALFGSKSSCLHGKVSCNTSAYPDAFAQKLRDAVGHGDGVAALKRICTLHKRTLSLSAEAGGVEKIGEVVSRRTRERMRELFVRRR